MNLNGLLELQVGYPVVTLILVDFLGHVRRPSSVKPRYFTVFSRRIVILLRVITGEIFSLSVKVA